MGETEYFVTPALISGYSTYLRNQEKAENTIHQYEKNLNDLCLELDGVPLTKAELIGWKKRLADKYAATTVNTILAALNGFLKFMGWSDIIVKPLKIQHSSFTDGNRDLSRKDYIRLVRTAEKQGNQRLALIMQTICSTGIRVSELKFITVEAVRTGKAETINKGKRRPVFLPDKLRQILKKYVQKEKISAGAVFVTKNGKALDRSNIWRDMKSLCKSAGVEPGKVFPHNLRHLFARIYYTLEKDLSRLADILGHSSVNTTRIYTAESGIVHARQMERMGLILTT